LAHTANAGTARRDPPLLFGAGPHQIRPPVSIDPRLPTGPEIAPRHERPRSLGAACSERVPVCVQRGAGGSGDSALRALAALELAYDRVVLALGIPAPLPDAGLGGSDALDLYLDSGAPELVVAHDPAGPSWFDSVATFCSTSVSDDSLLQRDATLCVGEAVANRLAAAETPALRRAFASELWWITGRVTALDVQAIDDTQAHPERALAAASAAPSAAAPLLLDLLERARSSQPAGGLVTALYAAAATQTSPGAWAWNDEPDVFDVLRHTLDEDTVRMATLMGDYAVARAFLGTRDDGTHPPYGEWAGDFARAHYDWVIRYSSLPRRVRSSRLIEPTGIELVWLDMDEVPLGASLGFQAEWEAPVAFQWRLISVDEHGQEMARVDVPFQERARSVEGRVVNLTGVRTVLAVGINMGGVDLAHPFDPDLDPFEPQACTVYFARM